jgi:hypothetical protein
MKQYLPFLSIIIILLMCLLGGIGNINLSLIHQLCFIQIHAHQSIINHLIGLK